MPAALRWILYPILLIAGIVLASAALLGIAVILAYPQLPSLELLTDYQPKIPLRVYSADGYLIGEFGEERRALVRIEEVPAIMKQAILAAEDERFYQHGGVDTLGVLRAAYSNFIGAGKRQGASTITMQVARNFFLTTEKTLSRKLYEALLAFKIEHNLPKDEILQIYINQIYLGQRAYGFAAAAQIYFGKPLKDINIAEAAMLAGLPKAPSAYNPVANPKRAKLRQQYVLRRMHELGAISDAQLAEAQKQVLTIKHDANDFGVHAEFVAEMARQIVYERFQEDSYNKGLRVITTINRAEQAVAYASLRKGVMDYDRRHGYRGAEGYIDMQEIRSEQDDELLEEALADYDDSDELLAAVVLEANVKQIRAYLRGGEIITLTGDALKLASRMLDDKAPATRRLRRGAVIRLSKDDKQHWQISQMPEVEAAFLAASPVDGAIRALVGGFDFNRNKFNHATQAWRQPGSSFKPFIYSAALEKGYTPSSVIPDEPIVISAAETGSLAWEPKNYDGKYEGPMALRTGLAKSKNMVSIRLLKSIGTHYAQDYVTRFGFDAEKHPPYLTMALGAGSVTPWQQLTAYAIFANGGYKIEPHIVRQILDDKGNVLAESAPVVAGDEQLRVLDPRNAYLMDSMMHDVVRRGTATKALSLKRGDLAGKTGTTNDYIDAWFCGYQPTVVGVAWIGFDQPKKLGNGETGGTAALPMWIGFMEKALKGVPESYMEVPEGLVAIRANDPTGKSRGTEFIYQEHLPQDEEEQPGAMPDKQQAPAPVQDAKPRMVEKPVGTAP
ncbi:MAG: penicillin-binding protein 1A [Betaproteobacteria bacterium]|nr:penicillin-binding protein 1A [Betaproteobacteria bacterium]